MNLSENARAALKRVVEKFKSGDLSPVVEVARLKRGSPVPFDRWSFSNRVLAYVQSGGSTDLRGYRQWQEVNRHVKRGAKASAYILVPLTYTVEDEETGEEKRVMKGFKSVAVFAYCDTEGEPLEHDYRQTANPPPLSDAAEALGVEAIWQPLPDRLGSCSLDGERVRVGTDDPYTFFHELAHAAHARLNGGELKPGQDPEQETVAEFTAAVLMEMHGLEDRTGNAWQYIERLSDDPVIAITRALSTVEDVLGLLEEVA